MIATKIQKKDISATPVTPLPPEFRIDWNLSAQRMTPLIEAFNRNRGYWIHNRKRIPSINRGTRSFLNNFITICRYEMSNLRKNNPATYLYTWNSPENQYLTINFSYAQFIRKMYDMPAATKAEVDSKKGTIRNYIKVLVQAGFFEAKAEDRKRGRMRIRVNKEWLAYSIPDLRPYYENLQKADVNSSKAAIDNQLFISSGAENINPSYKKNIEVTKNLNKTVSGETNVSIIHSPIGEKIKEGVTTKGMEKLTIIPSGGADFSAENGGAAESSGVSAKEKEKAALISIQNRAFFQMLLKYAAFLSKRLMKTVLSELKITKNEEQEIMKRVAALVMYTLSKLTVNQSVAPTIKDAFSVVKFCIKIAANQWRDGKFKPKYGWKAYLSLQRDGGKWLYEKGSLRYLIDQYFTVRNMTNEPTEWKLPVISDGEYNLEDMTLQVQQTIDDELRKKETEYLVPAEKAFHSVFVVARRIFERTVFRNLPKKQQLKAHVLEEKLQTELRHLYRIWINKCIEKERDVPEYFLQKDVLHLALQAIDLVQQQINRGNFVVKYGGKNYFNPEYDKATFRKAIDTHWVNYQTYLNAPIFKEKRPDAYRMQQAWLAYEDLMKKHWVVPLITDVRMTYTKKVVEKIRLNALGKVRQMMGKHELTQEEKARLLESFENRTRSFSWRKMNILKLSKK